MRTPLRIGIAGAVAACVGLAALAATTRPVSFWEALAARLKLDSIDIKGCEAQGDANESYMTRYFLRRRPGYKVYLHVFHRSDNERAFHDHPWSFLTFILANGYDEVTPTGTRRIRPGMIQFRHATWRHRVHLIDDRKAVTIVVRGPRVREWGFLLKGGWIPWQQFFESEGCKVEE